MGAEPISSAAPNLSGFVQIRTMVGPGSQNPNTGVEIAVGSIAL
jgi:hypothetical protein